MYIFSECYSVFMPLCHFVTAHLHQNLLKTKSEIEKYTEETLAQQKDKASDVSGIFCLSFCLLLSEFGF